MPGILWRVAQLVKGNKAFWRIPTYLRKTRSSQWSRASKNKQIVSLARLVYKKA